MLLVHLGTASEQMRCYVVIAMPSLRTVGFLSLSQMLTFLQLKEEFSLFQASVLLNLVEVH